MSVTRQEFQNFVKKYDADHREFKQMLQQLLAQPIPLNPGGTSSPMFCVFDRFSGIIPNPNSGRTSKQSSFINVAEALRAGITSHNESVSEQDPKIETSELDGSLLSWSHSVYSTVGNIIGRYSGLNNALGNSSLNEAKNLQYFATRPSRYNRELSAVINEIKKTVPIVKLAQGDWAARELLRNKFQNARNATKRLEKGINKPSMEREHSSTHKRPSEKVPPTKPGSGARRDRDTGKISKDTPKTQKQNDISDSSTSEEVEKVAYSSPVNPPKRISEKRKRESNSSQRAKVRRGRTSKNDVDESRHVVQNSIRKESKRRLQNITRTTRRDRHSKKHVLPDSSDTESEYESSQIYLDLE